MSERSSLPGSRLNSFKEPSYDVWVYRDEAKKTCSPVIKKKKVKGEKGVKFLNNNDAHLTDEKVII